MRPIEFFKFICFIIRFIIYTFSFFNRKNIKDERLINNLSENNFE